MHRGNEEKYTGSYCMEEGIAFNTSPDPIFHVVRVGMIKNQLGSLSSIMLLIGNRLRSQGNRTWRNFSKHR